MKSNAELGFANVHAIPEKICTDTGGRDVALVVGRRGDVYRASAELREPAVEVGGSKLVDRLVARADSASMAMAMLRDQASKFWTEFNANIALDRAVAELQESLDEAGLTGEKTTNAKERKMLVLSRKLGEKIVINDDITITVVEIRGNKVRLGVEAPIEIPVHRLEVAEAIRREALEGVAARLGKGGGIVSQGNTYPGGQRHAMSQSEHEAWNASHYPGTRQVCCVCGQPTGRCEEDGIWTACGEPLCEEHADHARAENEEPTP